MGEMRKQQEKMNQQRAEMEQQRLLKLKQQEEERMRNEKLRYEAEKQERTTTMSQKTEVSYQKTESSEMESLRKQHEAKLLERQRLEMAVAQEANLAKGQVAKRSDDVHGLGWGNVTTGFVSRKKLGFLQRAVSSERDWSVEGSPAPSDSKARGMRVTWADSPAGSRPDSRLQDVDTLRAQTPPLAGEWAVSRVAESKQMSSSSSAQLTSGHSSSMQASQSASFSSSQQMSSSFQSTNTFEAFPGMGGIENLKLDQ